MGEPAAAPIATYKLLLMGDSGVGKSSILLRFVEDRFLGEDVHAATIGVDFKVKTVEVDGARTKLTIWDTAGQERFRTLTSSYYRGAHGVVLVYDVASRPSFENLALIWLRELQTYANLDEMVLMLVANKIDKEAARVVSREEGLECAQGLAALYMECSAKTKVGIAAAFDELVHKIAHSPRLLAARQDADRARVHARLGASEETGAASLCSC